MPEQRGRPGLGDQIGGAAARTLIGTSSGAGIAQTVQRLAGQQRSAGSNGTSSGSELVVDYEFADLKTALESGAGSVLDGLTIPSGTWLVRAGLLAAWTGGFGDDIVACFLGLHSVDLATVSDQVITTTDNPSGTDFNLVAIDWVTGPTSVDLSLFLYSHNGDSLTVDVASAQLKAVRIA